MTEPKFTEEEFRRILAETVRPRPAASASAEYSQKDLEDAAREVGIGPEAVHAARETVEQRSGVRRAAVFVAVLGLVVSVALVVFVTGADERLPSIQIHNERNFGERVEILVPKARSACQSSGEHFPHGAEYCRWTEVRLGPGEEREVELPSVSADCPFTWIRTSVTEATFMLPASIEIERDGTLDQKGVGAPQRYGPPVLRGPGREVTACARETVDRSSTEEGVAR